MAGSDADTAVDDDALYVLTAVLLTPAKFPSVLGDDYPEACAALGLLPIVDGYGLVLGQDSQGARWTVVTDDVSLVAVAIASWDCGMEYELSPGDSTVVSALPGWPLAVAVAAPGIPAPHDPEPDPDDPDGLVLSPPDSSTWGPAQRRLSADEIALQWAIWRARVDEADEGPADAELSEEAEAAERVEEAEVAVSAEGDAVDAGSDAGAASDGETGGDTAGDDSSDTKGDSDAVNDEPQDSTDSEPEPEPDGADPDPEDAAAAADGSPIRRVLAEARAYIDTPPPLGRVRSAFASGEARTLRADGPGWSMVARTDDIAFVLLDEEPGEVLPVGRGPELPGLLEALDKMAVRPS
ncbi:hypothetical protein H9Y04_33555 [Streptomyces sp. TRM66268-LWL]|uniref:Integral membrane protein n=1 Tax=Streptomyces polyasparticus TaxID=2767826 RepID=A0ABR7SR98_9ACTN|nr:hypothetical protein [Streptomyces polyasparticus]MBC9717467.1 hypothetical protein [Streptomyces polyasparticus]